MRAWTVDQLKRYAAELEARSRALEIQADVLEGTWHWLKSNNDPAHVQVGAALKTLREAARGDAHMSRGLLAIPRDEELEDTLPLGLSPAGEPDGEA